MVMSSSASCRPLKSMQLPLDVLEKGFNVVFPLMGEQFVQPVLAEVLVPSGPLVSVKPSV
jgi:hypothetical protein